MQGKESCGKLTVTGLRLKPKIDREVLGIEPEAAYKLERQIEKEWELWADSTDCDAARVDNFCELQQLAFMSWLLSGDCLAMLPVKPRRAPLGRRIGHCCTGQQGVGWNSQILCGGSYAPIPPISETSRTICAISCISDLHTSPAYSSKS